MVTPARKTTMKCAMCGRAITREEIEKKNPEVLEAFDKAKDRESWVCSADCTLGFALSRSPEDVVDPGDT
jgi:hypothetical protein